MHVFTRVNNSLAHRVPYTLRLFLKNWVPRKVVAKNTIELNYCTFISGKKYLQLLNINLITVYYKWKKLPNVIIVHDDTIDKEEIKYTIRWWPAKLLIYSWEELPFKNDSFKEFAYKSVYGKKLHVIEALPKPLLWFDTDILWFDDWKKLKTDEDIKICEDIDPCYDPYFVAKYPEIINKPYGNVGLVYIKEELEFDRNTLIDLSEISVHPHQFSEQSLLALRCIKHKIEPWPLSKVYLELEDKHRHTVSFVNKGWVARHYAGPSRHLFWRDAFYMRYILKY